MWIDALCIDQADLQEKGHQVAHMGQIFRRADRVVIWLGDTGDVPPSEIWVEHFITRKPMGGKSRNRLGFLDIPWYVRHVFFGVREPVMFMLILGTGLTLYGRYRNWCSQRMRAFAWGA